MVIITITTIIRYYIWVGLRGHHALLFISFFLLEVCVIFLMSWPKEDFILYQWQGLHAGKVDRTEKGHAFNLRKQRTTTTYMAAVNYTDMCKYR